MNQLQKNQYKRYTRSKAGNAFYFLFLILGGIFSTLPIVYCVITSFKPLEELLLFPPRFFVNRPVFDNYSVLPKLLSNLTVPFSRYVFNSIFITAITLILHVFLASMAAFVLSKKQFRGRKTLFLFIQLSLLYNSYTLAVPQYIIFSKLHIIDTYLVYILPYLPSTLGVFLTKQFMDASVPQPLIEAARIDGAGFFRIYFKIAMPISKPAWLTVLLFSFRELWSLQPQGTVFSEELKTLPSVMNTISQGGLARSGSAMAATALLMIPTIAVYWLTQSNVMKTMGTSGIK